MFTLGISARASPKRVCRAQQRSVAYDRLYARDVSGSDGAMDAHGRTRHGGHATEIHDRSKRACHRTPRISAGRALPARRRCCQFLSQSRRSAAARRIRQQRLAIRIWFLAAWQACVPRTPTTADTVRLSLETPFVQWFVRAPVQLPGDLAVFQLGPHQICVVDPNERKVALLVKGRGPVAKHCATGGIESISTTESGQGFLGRTC